MGRSLTPRHGTVGQLHPKDAFDLASDEFVSKYGSQILTHSQKKTSKKREDRWALKWARESPLSRPCSVAIRILRYAARSSRCNSGGFLERPPLRRRVAAFLLLCRSSQWRERCRLGGVRPLSLPALAQRCSCEPHWEAITPVRLRARRTGGPFSMWPRR